MPQLNPMNWLALMVYFSAVYFLVLVKTSNLNWNYKTEITTPAKTDLKTSNSMILKI